MFPTTIAALVVDSVIRRASPATPPTTIAPLGTDSVPPPANLAASLAELTPASSQSATISVRAVPPSARPTKDSPKSAARPYSSSTDLVKQAGDSRQTSPTIAKEDRRDDCKRPGGTDSTPSQDCMEKMGTRWNASLPIIFASFGVFSGPPLPRLPSKTHCRPPPGCGSLRPDGKPVNKRERHDDAGAPGFSIRRLPQPQREGQGGGASSLPLRLERGEVSKFVTAEPFPIIAFSLWPSTFLLRLPGAFPLYQQASRWTSKRLCIDLPS